MRRYTCHGVAAFSVLCMAAPALAGAPARTPDELVQNLISAAREGNSEEFLSSLTDGARHVVEDAAQRGAVQVPRAGRGEGPAASPARWACSSRCAS
jgi:hypothetical protein